MDAKEKTFLEILDTQKGIIYKIANTYSYNKSDQDDLIQEITLQIWRSIENYNSLYKRSTWIYRIALNTSISFYRKNKARKERILNLDSIIEIPISCNNSSLEDKNLILLKRFIKELKEIDRALILLHLEGLSSQEIANIIAISQTNVTSKIHRIKKKLKIKFKNHKYV